MSKAARPASSPPSWPSAIHSPKRHTSNDLWQLVVAVKATPGLLRAFKLREKLGGDGGGDYIPKPKWMRWPTYSRRLEEVAAAERSWTPICWRSSKNSAAV